MIPRIVVAGTSSGAGKTSVACGLIAALRARGLVVQGFKVGPDYIDPSYHSLASGRPGRNLDAFLAGPDLIAPLARHGSAGADVAVIEGVMGLFDGASGRGELASTGHVAKLLRAPVLLVIDAASMARSVAAVVHGYRSYDPAIDIAGVVLNKVGSDVHEGLLREAIEPLGVPVVGALRRDERVGAPERHLGLVPAGEREAGTRAAIEALGAAAAGRVDLDAVLALARAAPAAPGPSWSPDPPDGALAQASPAAAGPAWSPDPPDGAMAQASPAAPGPAWSPDPPDGAMAQASPAAPGPVRSPGPPDGPLGARAVVAIARGPAFSFHYEENLELLRAAGAELVAFDPIADERLPEGADALVLAGGFPEVFGAELSANAALRERVAAFAGSGRPVVAECGGLLYLCEELDGRPMCGVMPATARMAGRLSIGYREATAIAESACWAGGEAVRGHEFHYSHVEPRDGGDAAAWTLAARGREWPEGVVAGGVHASFLHVHWAAFPQAARRLVAAAARSGDRAPAGTWA